MRGFVRHLSIALTALLLASTASALGLGDIKTESKLGDPLLARITLNGTDGMTEEELIISIADQATYDRMGIEREYLHTRMKFTPVIDKKTGKSEIVVTTSDNLKTPFINFVLQVKWPQGNAMKSYTILLDTPVGK